MNVVKKKNKMHVSSNYLNKENYKLFKAKWLVEKLIINDDQIL
jgi:hypothetical protein